MGKLIFSDNGWIDYLYWQSQDRKVLRKINDLLKDISRNGPLQGIGKPEALKENLSGCFSRRIDEKNRLVYRISASGEIEIVQCKGHYND